MTRLKLSPDVIALNPSAGAKIDTSERKKKVPRAAPEPPTGYLALVRAGWSCAWCPKRGWRLYKINGPDAGWHGSERAAVLAAKGLEQ